ncbi:MAG: ribosome recycling factor [Holosporales bacterium]|jgi:ribosome recycling factor|nr:ribosome recycling factor [Holosporales bacterium]
MSKEQIDPRLSDFDARMCASEDALAQEFQGIRTNRASTSLLDPIRVDVYSSLVPLQQVGTVSAPDARTLVIQVWDKSAVKAVEKAIRESDLGLNPSSEGQNIRIPMPPLTEERRVELSKIAAKYAEETRVAIRNVRRDAMDWIKKNQKSGVLTEDDEHRLGDEIQKITDCHVKNVDVALDKKQKDIMAV